MRQTTLLVVLCNGLLPTVIAQCTTLPSTPSGALSPSCLLPSAVGSSCTLTCLADYYSTASAFVCQTGNTWSSPQCLYKKCTTLPSSVTNGASPSCLLPVNDGATCALTCNSGYYATASYSCSLGTWSTPSCLSSSCSSQPAAVTYGVAPSCTLPALNTAYCQLSCTTGKQPTAYYQCLNGTWTSPRCVGSIVFGDPHFQSLSGGSFEVRGIPGHIYNIITDTFFNWNAEFVTNLKEKRSRAATFIGRTGFILNGTRITLDPATNTVLLENHTLEVSGERVWLTPSTFVKRESSLIILRAPGFRIALKLRTKDGAKHVPHFDHVIDYIPGDTGLVHPHGILGQTAHFKKPIKDNQSGPQGEGVLEGQLLDYEVPGLFSTEFRFSRYGATLASLSELQRQELSAQQELAERPWYEQWTAAHARGWAYPLGTNGEVPADTTLFWYNLRTATRMFNVRFTGGTSLRVLKDRFISMSTRLVSVQGWTDHVDTVAIALEGSTISFNTSDILIVGNAPLRENEQKQLTAGLSVLKLLRGAALLHPAYTLVWRVVYGAQPYLLQNFKLSDSSWEMEGLLVDGLREGIQSYVLRDLWDR